MDQTTKPKQRTYDWNGHTNIPISYPQRSDEEMAGIVRMLMRSDITHEYIVTAARDRIMALVKEKQELRDALHQWRTAEQTNDPVEFNNARAARDAALANDRSDVR